MRSEHKLSDEPDTLGLPDPSKKILGNPSVSNPLLGLPLSVELWIASVPVRSLLTKKSAPPPSLAWLCSMIEPATVTV
jgi:hypothetical protein